MHLRKKVAGENGAAEPPEFGGDRISALPDDVLNHILGFLLAEEAVRTCVLARRWSNLWKSATGLRISCRNEKEVKKVQEFVDRLLLLRGGSPLDTCELRLFPFDSHNVPRVRLWIQRVLMCKLRVLSLRIHRGLGNRLELGELTLASQHLKRQQLSGLQLNDSLLDFFSSCPTLEIPENDDCDFLNVSRISSQSLKCLGINSECSFGVDSRTRIYAPNLVSLQLEVGYNTRIPVLERMPSLVDAVVKIKGSDFDSCNIANSGDCGDEDCFSCYGIDGDTNNCVLLQGLSEAQSLALICDPEIFILRRDLKWCPIFSNLKTLLLNEYWCV